MTESGHNGPVSWDATATGREIHPPGMNMYSASRMWGNGWRRYFFPAFWLVYLGQTVSGVEKHSHGPAAIAGYLIVVVFAAVYLTALSLGRSDRWPLFWTLFAVGLGLTAIECVFAHQDALVFLVYSSVLIVAAQRPVGLLGVVALTLVAALVPRFMPGWGHTVDWSTALSVLLVSLAMYGFFKIIYANIALTAARAEVARLAAENERSRIARDLHDLLGHSLTTITVKAGLARRLAERGDDERARTEIAEVEQLARRTLGDVRAAVSAHREVTLAGELATASEVLRAAGIIAELPPTVAEVAPDLSELFGWVVREGITNVVRHSRAEHVGITLAPRAITIHDDGRGASGPCGSGNGLRGLRERVEARGGALQVGGGSTNGFTVCVEVPEPAPAASAPRAHESSSR